MLSIVKGKINNSNITLQNKMTKSGRMQSKRTKSGRMKGTSSKIQTVREPNKI